MLRSTFFSVGLFVALCGGSLLFIDKIVLDPTQAPVRPSGFRGLFASMATPDQKTIDPPDWAAFSLISIGAITMLYAVALPRKG